MLSVMKRVKLKTVSDICFFRHIDIEEDKRGKYVIILLLGICNILFYYESTNLSFFYFIGVIFLNCCTTLWTDITQRRNDGTL